MSQPQGPYQQIPSNFQVQGQGSGQPAPVMSIVPAMPAQQEYYPPQYNLPAVYAPQPLYTGPSALFTGPHEQPGMKRPHVIPGIAHVYVTADGNYIVRTKRPTFREAFAAKRRYDVDVTDHPTPLVGNDLPSARNNFYFPYEITFTWRVNDPIAIVRRGVKDGVVVVNYAVTTRLRQITAVVEPDAWAQAEARINAEFGNGLILPEGIEIVTFTAQLRIDPRMAQFLQSQAEAQGKIQIDALNRAAVESAMQRGDLGLVIEHLTQNPGSTMEVIGLFNQNRQVNDQSRQELLKLLVDNNVIQDVDLERFRDILLPQNGEAATAALLGSPQLTLDGSGANNLGSTRR